ncbi:MAG: hypothetical protein WDO73_35470 [Ignavibacteriota bacterium]
MRSCSGSFRAWQTWKGSPLQMMKSGPGGGMHPRRFALRDLLLGAQIAICTLLVTASLVAARGMVRALQVPLGIQPKGAMLASLDLSEQAGQRRESDPRWDEQYPRCDRCGYREPHALYRRHSWDADLPARDD